MNISGGSVRSCLTRRPKRSGRKASQPTKQRRIRREKHAQLDKIRRRRRRRMLAPLSETLSVPQRSLFAVSQLRWIFTSRDCSAGSSEDVEKAAETPSRLLLQSFLFVFLYQFQSIFSSHRIMQRHSSSIFYRHFTFIFVFVFTFYFAGYFTF